MKALTIITIMLLSLCFKGLTQQYANVTDSMPILIQGLKIGYEITDASEKEVGKKGDFSRYKIRFFVTNTNPDAKITMHKPGFNLFGSGSISDALANFKCSNATGARLTNKEATVRTKPCYVDALVDDKDCGSNKTVQNKRQVNLGYWIKSGETLSTSTIMIVPLNEKPRITVALYPESGSITATAGYGSNAANTQSFYHIKSFLSNNYLNNQNSESLACTGIDMGWWSAQWEIAPVAGTSYYTIRNRWKGSYLSTASFTMLAADAQQQQSMWLLDDAGNNTYTIKNAATGQKLIYQNGTLTTAVTLGTPDNTKWILEQ